MAESTTPMWGTISVVRQGDNTTVVKSHKSGKYYPTYGRNRKLRDLAPGQNASVFARPSSTGKSLLVSAVRLHPGGGSSAGESNDEPAAA